MDSKLFVEFEQGEPFCTALTSPSVDSTMRWISVLVTRINQNVLSFVSQEIFDLKPVRDTSMMTSRILFRDTLIQSELVVWG
jgi:hypothetical protein